MVSEPFPTSWYLLLVEIIARSRPRSAWLLIRGLQRDKTGTQFLDQTADSRGLLAFERTNLMQLVVGKEIRLPQGLITCAG